jgi:hypothetical protein
VPRVVASSVSATCQCNVSDEASANLYCHQLPHDKEGALREVVLIAVFLVMSFGLAVTVVDFLSGWQHDVLL